MRRIWLTAVATYRRRVRSVSFLITTFGLPAIFVFASAVPILLEINQAPRSVGIVDESGSLAPVSQLPENGEVRALRRFDDLDAARRALDAGQIDGILLLPQDYGQGGQARYYALESPGGGVETALEEVVRRGRLPDAPDWLIQRLGDATANVSYESLDTGVEVSQGPGLVLWIGLPPLLGLVFALAVLTGAAQMGEALVREKDQRALEIVVTSMRPAELVAGKVVGLTLLSLTQLAIWGAGAGAAILILLSGESFAGSLRLPWHAVGWAALLGAPGYFLYAFLASGLGILAGDGRQAQQLAGILGFVAMAPLWLLGSLIQHPDGPLAVGLTLFPLTAPIYALVRLALTDVPAWQLLLALGLEALALGLAAWGVSRLFRASMLLYGQGLRPREILRALRAS